jgi:hypothetical protein
MKKSSKPKKPNLAKLKRIAFKLWSEIVRKDGYCKYCEAKNGDLKQNGKPTILNAHHVIGRENYALCWDILNGVCLCQNCHKFSRHGAHRGGIIFSEWFRVTHPETYEYLLRNYNKEVNITVEYVQGIIDNFKEILKNE